MYKEVIPHLKEKLTQWRYEPFDDAILLVIKYPCGNVSANLTENEKKNPGYGGSLSELFPRCVELLIGGCFVTCAMAGFSL